MPINLSLAPPGVRAMVRHAAASHIADIYTTAGLPAPMKYLHEMAAHMAAKRPAATLLYRIVPAKSATARPRPPKVERARAQVLEMRARLARVEMGVLRARYLH